MVTKEDEEGGRRLVGYVVAKEAEEVTSSELRSYLKERLPDLHGAWSHIGDRRNSCD